MESPGAVGERALALAVARGFEQASSPRRLDDDEWRVRLRAAGGGRDECELIASRRPGVVLVHAVCPPHGETHSTAAASDDELAGRVLAPALARLKANEGLAAANLALLPRELLADIASRLGERDVANLKATCRRLRDFHFKFK